MVVYNKWNKCAYNLGIHTYNETKYHMHLWYEIEEGRESQTMVFDLLNAYYEFSKRVRVIVYSNSYKMQNGDIKVCDIDEPGSRSSVKHPNNWL